MFMHNKSDIIIIMRKRHLVILSQFIHKLQYYSQSVSTILIHMCGEIWETPTGEIV